VAVGVPAAHLDTLLSHVIAGEALMDTWERKTVVNTRGEIIKREDYDVEILIAVSRCGFEC